MDIFNSITCFGYFKTLNTSKEASEYSQCPINLFKLKAQRTRGSPDIVSRFKIEEAGPAHTAEIAVVVGS